MNRRSKCHIATLCKAQSLTHRSYTGKGSSLKWCHLCARGEIRTSLPAFCSEHTLTSMGPGAGSPQEGRCLDMNRMEGQRWSQYSQHSLQTGLCSPSKTILYELETFYLLFSEDIEVLKSQNSNSGSCY